MREGSSWIRRGLFISLLAALTMGVYACTDSDDDSNVCEQGASKCENNKKIVCVNGEWKATNIDCDIGGGNNNGGNNNGGNNNGGNNNGGNNNGGNNNGGNNNGGNNNGNACEMLDAGQSCSACTPVCSADGSTAYLCNTKTGKSMKWTCDNNDCAVNGSKVTCTKPGGGNGGGGSNKHNTKCFFNSEMGNLRCRSCNGSFIFLPCSRSFFCSIPSKGTKISSVCNSFYPKHMYCGMLYSSVLFS